MPSVARVSLRNVSTSCMTSRSGPERSISVGYGIVGRPRHPDRFFKGSHRGDGVDGRTESSLRTHLSPLPEREREDGLTLGDFGMKGMTES